MEFKIALLGDGGVGKTTLLNVLNGDYGLTYYPTLGINIQPLQFQTTMDPFNVSVWDFAGQEKYAFDNLKVTCTNANAAIIMFALSSQKDNIKYWIDAFQKESPGKPIILIGSKSDLQHRLRTPKVYPFPYLEISALKHGTLEATLKPFNYLAKLLVNPNIEFN